MANNITGQDRPIMRDVTVLSCANAPTGGGALGTALDFIAIIETVEINIKRAFGDTTSSTDRGSTRRATRWDFGSVKLTGFSSIAQSKFANLFSQGGHAQLLFTEASSGDKYQLMCSCEDFTKSLGKDATKDSLTLTVEGEPYYATGAGTLTAMALE